MKIEGPGNDMRMSFAGGHDNVSSVHLVVYVFQTRGSAVSTVEFGLMETSATAQEFIMLPQQVQLSTQFQE